MSSNSSLRRWLAIAIACLAAPGIGCEPRNGAPDAGDAATDAAPGPRPQTPDPWAGPVSLATAQDTNPDPRVIEVALEARMGEWEIAPGQRVTAMTYNGSVPGPLLEGRVGDTLVVHFTNRLSEPTTIHWHGVRVPNNMDGAQMSQTPVPPGGTFDYRFELTDPGTYWYHPHANEAFQMERGLYGGIVVRGANEPAVEREGVLLLDDLTLGPDGQIAPRGGFEENHDGREGPVQLVNGRTNVTIPIRAGARQRWRIVNAGSARFYRLALAGHRFTLIGTDGGPIEAPRELDELVLTPGDRADVVVTGTGAPGSSATLQTLPYNRGHGAGTTTPHTVMTVQYAGDPALDVLPLPASLARIDRINTDGVTPRMVVFDQITDTAAMRVIFRINRQAFPDVPHLETRLGTTEVWDLVNEGGVDHPFHLHGYFFQVVSRDGVPEPFASWEDTVILRGDTTTRVVFRPDDRPGAWMFHCHILEHIENGMMAHLMVSP